MNIWTALILIAAALVLGVAIYVAVWWRRAPAAFRAIGVVAAVCLVAGFLTGVWGFHLAVSRFASSRAPSPSRASTSSAPADSVSVSEVGKAIIEMDEKHAGDPNWISSAATVEMCNQGVGADMLLCRGAYLARHVIGKDMEHGPRGISVPLSDVADFCDMGLIAKGSDLCKEAYDARRVKMK